MLDRKVILLRRKFITNLHHISKSIEKKGKKFKGLQHSTFILGVSGGPDSVALLDLFYNISLRANTKLIVAHFNHKIRGKEANRDETFVKEICRRLNLKILVGKLKHKLKIINEENLRNIRFRFFRKIVTKFKANFLALAHTKDDNLETVFMNLLKGKIQKPVIGIELWRPFTKSSFLIHPLLNISRAELLEYTIHSNLNFVIDSSNLKDNFFRNYIRHKIFPTFKTFRNSFLRSLEFINTNWGKLSNET